MEWGNERGHGNPQLPEELVVSDVAVGPRDPGEGVEGGRVADRGDAIDHVGRESL